MNSGMTELRTIHDEAGFEKLRDEWDELLEASTSPCFFLTWEWLFTWWKHLSGGRTLRIVTLRDGGRLAAIAPMARRPPSLPRLLPIPALEFLGSGIIGSDYLDCIVRAGQEREACRAVAEHLGRETLMLELTQLRRNSCAAAAVAARMGNGGWSVAEARTNVCPYINLSGHSWQSYLATLGSDHRYNLQRRLKNLTKQFDVRLERVCSEDERRLALRTLIDLHNRRWQGRRDCSEAFYSSSLLSFHDEVSRLALERGWLRLFVLRLDGRPAAALYGFRYRRTFYYFQAGFDPGYRKHSVGLAMMGLAIRSAIEEGVEEYDLLHGDEPYKFHWARDAHELGRLELFPAGVRGWVYRGALRASRVARKAGRFVLPKAIADRIVLGGLKSRSLQYVPANR